MFLVFGFIIFSMKDGIPLIVSIENKGTSIPKIELPSKIPVIIGKTPNIITSGKDLSGFKKFSSKNELKEYLEKSSSSQNIFDGGNIRTMTAFEGGMVSAPGVSRDFKGGASESGVSTTAQRVSDTNVQVSGIDEPDILKTDGENIYFSSQNYYRGISEPMIEMDIESKSIMPYYINRAKTKIIKAFPPSDLEEKSSVDESGNLLISENNLIIFSGNFIYGYDIKDSENPKKKWNIELKNNNQFVQARLYNDKVYLITRKGIKRQNPCPIIPFAVEKEDITISCESIYHPDVIVPADVTYNISTINVDTGKMDIGISFLGSYNSTIYMSKNSLYIAYAYSSDMINFFYNFILENNDIFSNAILERIKTLKGYDISQNTKMTELQIALEKFKNSMDKDDRLKFENEMQNRMSSYTNKHKRNLQKTDIVKVALSSLSVDSIGTVPGTLLNQFAIDEYKNNLRVATTIGQRSFRFGFFGSQQSENDIYVLDGNMNIMGFVLGLGLDERIYSVRFIEDKGYLVTFKQIDPFFVMDLSNPKQPKITGKLKIPGYSSYLHPIDKDRIVGVGKEGSKVKISLFDVSDPKNPKESAKYILDEYWSDVLNTHHAFLLDDKHKIFFMPGNKGGYVFSYKDGGLKFQKAVSGVLAKRALYLDDYLYIVGNDKIVVLNELTWERVNELKFGFK
jgi:uncharacterized secreted protein with C-terminal beta-propeller domain